MDPVDESPEPGEDGAEDTARRGALRVVEALRAAGHEAVWAGGCVRDRVLGLAPKDYDVATDARPEQVIALFDHTVAVGAQFGVIQVLLGRDAYEVATYRADLHYEDGRRPTGVRWADAREDVLRRDFTINGLLYDPIADELIDFVGGQEDLAAGIVRAIGDPRARFSEDHLRVLRAVRFAARFGFEIDPPTWEAVVAMADSVASVSAERVYEELRRLFTEGGAPRALELLEAADMTRVVLPELAGGEARARARFDGLGAVPQVLGWALALHDLGDGDSPTLAADVAGRVAAIGERLRFSRALTRDLTQVLTAARGMEAWPSLSLAARKRIARVPVAGVALGLVSAVVAAGQADPAGAHAAAEDLRRWSTEDLWPAPLIDGNDLRRAGYRPGPGFAKALTAVEDAQLEGRAHDRDAALEIARGVLGAPPEA